MLVEYHRNLLGDRLRNEAFHRALQSVIVPGDTIVADIGSGTGLLGFLASKLGAKAVYLYEYGEVMDLAKKLARVNKIRNVHFVADHSANAEEPVPVDVIVSETLGNFAFEEHMIATLNDARRFLKPGGVIIPRRVDNFVAPVTTDRFHRELTVWDDVGFGLDYSVAKAMSFNNIYVRVFQPQDLLPASQKWDSVDFMRKNASRRQGDVEWQISRASTVYGLCVWWECELVPGNVLSTSPHAQKTHWEQLYFPVAEPVTLERGDILSARLTSESTHQEGTVITWQITRQRGKFFSRQSFDLRKGYLG